VEVRRVRNTAKLYGAGANFDRGAEKAEHAECRFISREAAKNAKGKAEKLLSDFFALFA
jgi:hypothetical protein